MLIQIKLQFEILSPPSIKSSTNLSEALHGWLFHQLQNSNEDISELIHKQVMKPFSIELHCNPDKNVHEWNGTVNAFGSDANWVLDACMSAQGKEGVIAGVHVLLKNTRIVRWETFEQLNEEAIPNMIKEFKVHFLTPCSFRNSGFQNPYPAPELVFKSLRNRWDAFCGLPQLYKEIDWQCAVFVKKFDLRTKAVPFGRFLIVGSLGYVTYGLANLYKDDHTSSFMHRLLRFGEYAGVGYKTSMGLGEIQYSTRKNGMDILQLDS